LGSPILQNLLEKLKPRYWFSAHLHVKFEATVDYANCEEKTTFLALDKCLPKREFLEILEIKVENEENNYKNKFYYDKEWLLITKLFNPYYSSTKEQKKIPIQFEKEEIESIQKFIDENIKELEVLDNFKITTSIYDKNVSIKEYPTTISNNQLVDFIEMMKIDDYITQKIEKNNTHYKKIENPNEINLF
jgi:lariat debranching enzyme